MNRTMKLRSMATIPSRSGGMKRRRNFSGGSCHGEDRFGQHEQDAGWAPVAGEDLDPAEDHPADQDDQVDRQHIE